MNALWRHTWQELKTIAEAAQQQLWEQQQQQGPGRLW
jgi:hypothetical protein